MKRFIITVLAVAFSACAVAKEPSSPAAGEQAAASVKSGHNYVLREKERFGYQYGYERAISESDRQHGRVAADVLMLRYHGQKAGVHQLSSVGAGMKVVMECEMPCEFFKQSFWDGTTKVKTERARTAEGSLAWGIIQDVKNGKLLPMSKVESGKKMRAWVTDEGPVWEPN